MPITNPRNAIVVNLSNLKPENKNIASKQGTPKVRCLI